MPEPSRPGAEAPPFRVGDFEAEPGLNELRGPDGPVRVEPKVMEVLLALARRPGETLARETLLEEIWGGKYVVEAVLTRCVSELRRVFGDEAQSPRYIQTVARRGYRLVAPVVPLVVAGGDVASSRNPARALPSSPSARTGRLMIGVLLIAIALLIAGFLLGRTGRGPGGAPATRTPHPEAYRLYLQAREPLRQGLCEGRAALALLERALQLDPDFAAAWEEYGWARYNAVASCGESGENYGKALEAAGRALALRADSPRAMSLKAAVLVETGRAEEAFALLEAAPPQANRDRELRFLRSYVLTYAGYLRSAVAISEELAGEDPAFFTTAGWTPNALLYGGNAPRFLALLPQGASPLLRYYRGWALSEDRREKEALHELQPAFRSHPSDVFARLAEALVAILEDRAPDARLLLGQLALQRERLDASDGEVTFKLAQLLARAGEAEAALGQLRQAVSQGFFCPTCISADRAFLSLRSRPAFAALLHDAARRHDAFGRRFGVVELAK